MTSMVSAGVPEVSLGDTAPTKQSVPPTFSGAWGDFAKDMAAIEAEQQPAQPGPTVNGRAAQAVVTPVQPQIEPQAPIPAQQEAPKTVEVPDKFRAPDGSVDIEKMTKSYLEAEKKLKQSQNQQQVQPQQQMAPEPQIQQQLTPFEIQVARDIFTQGGFTEQQAIGLARVQVNLLEAKHRADATATFSKVAQFEQTLEETNRRNELSALAKNQPWVMSPQGQADLIRIRQEVPEVNNSSQPWRAAVIYLLGEKALQGQVPGQVMPTPTAMQQTVPPMQAIAAQRTSNPIQLNNPDDVAAYVKTLTPAQEAEFWQKAGFKWEAPRKQYMGI